MKKQLILGTRGSLLALTQSGHVADMVCAANPGLEVVLKTISTQGDKILDAPLAKIGGKGLFTKELESALLDGSIDLAVHSMKDLPTELPDGLAVGAVPVRANPLDAFISARWMRLALLPEGAVVGTSSLRRKAQLSAVRPDLRIVDLRGNIDTRLRKVQEQTLDAAIMACAGIERIGRADAVMEVLSPETMLPAPGQGALAIEIRANDASICEILATIQDARAEAEVAAERAMLAALGGGCQVPIGALGRVEGDNLTLHGCVCSLDGRIVIRTTISGLPADAETLGRQAAESLLEQGADQFVREALQLMSSPSLSAKPLAGKRLVVTRPRQQAEELAQRFQDLGGDVFLFPTVAIQAIETPSPLPDKKYDWVLFTSMNAVDAFFCQPSSLPIITGAKIGAIGRVSAEALERRGISVTLMPTSADAASLLDAVLHHEKNVNGMSFLLPQSAIALDVLAEGLKQHGAMVTQQTVYKTVMPETSNESRKALMAFNPDILTFASPSAIKHFCQMLNDSAIEHFKQTTFIAVIGPTTAQTARELGFQVHAEATQHDAAGLVDAVVALCQRLQPHKCEKNR